MHFPGSTHVGIAKIILEGYSWWEFEPHPEWVAPSVDDENCWNPYSADIPGQVRIIYMPQYVVDRVVSVCEIEPGVRYEAKFVNPSNGNEIPIGIAEPDTDGQWLLPMQPEMRDWIVILEVLT